MDRNGPEEKNILSLRDVIQVMNSQKRREVERIQALVEASTVPLPDDVVRALSMLNPADVRDVIRNHAGFKNWERLGSYRVALSVFRQCIDDLFSAISVFDTRSKDGSIFDARRNGELAGIKRVVQKELFSCANAAHSLVDHSTRRLQKSIEIPKYSEKLQMCFGNDGLHEFIISLRTLLHHLHMVEPGWNVQHNFEGGQQKGSFKLNRDELLKAIERERKAFGKNLEKTLEFIQKSPASIDLENVFQDYRTRADTFYSWFDSELEAFPMEAVRDYERCLLESKKQGARVYWNMMIGNWVQWEKPPNPYDHLHKYLTEDQLSAILGLEKGSMEQIDAIIRVVDTDNACDAELRERIHKYFDKAMAAAETSGDS